jgi:DNA-directed RNA polymerase specialized sigma24 family protein
MEAPMTTFSQCITGSNEAQLVSAARAGSPDGLIEYLYSLLRSRAVALVGRFRAFNHSLEVDDLVQEGIEQVLYDLDKGLLIDRPVPWLLTAARHKMLHYCEEYRSPVRVPHSSQNRGAAVPLVMSLDAPLAGCEDLTLLDTLADTMAEVA